MKLRLGGFYTIKVQRHQFLSFKESHLTKYAGVSDKGGTSYHVFSTLNQTNAFQFPVDEIINNRWETKEAMYKIYRTDKRPKAKRHKNKRRVKK